MKIKGLLFFLILMAVAFKIKAQCTTGCTTTITVPSSANVNITADNMTICFIGTGSWTGNMEFNNRNNITICVGPNVTVPNVGRLNNQGPAAPGTKIINYGTWNMYFWYTLGANTDFDNYGSVTTVGFDLNAANTLTNYGTFTATTGTVRTNGLGSLVTKPGSMMTVNGNLEMPDNSAITLGGVIHVKGNMMVNSGTTITGTPPTCSALIVDGSFYSNGNIGQPNPIVANKAPSGGAGTFTGTINTTTPTVTTNPANQTVCAGTNASFAVSASGGAGITYQWQENSGSGFTNITNGGVYSGATTNTLTLTAPGAGMSGNQYQVVVTSCPYNVTSTPATLTVFSQPNATATATAVSGCFGNSTGSINFSGATGGGGTYQYSRDGGLTWVGSGTAFSITGLPAGTYDVRIRDAANPTCNRQLSAALVVNQPAQLNATVNSANVSGCNGNTNGSITISVPSGGGGTYQYTINGGTSWQASGNYTGLSAGTYNVQIRDLATPSCTRTLQAALAITQPSALNATVNSSVVTGCFGSSNGSITISAPVGGGGTYQYSINGSTWQSSGSFPGLTAGTYNVQMRDAVNTACSRVLNGTLSITQPLQLNAALNSTQVTGCAGNSNGSISLTTPTGGGGTYEYSINGGANWYNSGSFPSLVAGNYDVRIRDAAAPSCFRILNGTLNISQPVALNATLASSSVSGCFGNTNGSINISAPVGGGGTYQYTINGGTSWQATGSFPTLAAGTYDVRIRDAANITCTRTLNGALPISQPAQLNATLTANDVTGCNGNTNGSIVLSAPVGGGGTYQYSRDGGTNWVASGTFSPLGAGTYDVRIRDAANISCARTLSGALIITQPLQLNATVNSVNVSGCNGLSNGSITISAPVGGAGTYQYSINGGSTWQPSGSYPALAAGTYNLQIRDAANPTCIRTLNAALVITQPTQLNATVTPTQVSGCNGSTNGSIVISAPLGGGGTYQYTINGGTNWFASGSFPGLGAGTYNVQIRDAASTSCVRILNGALLLTQPTPITATASRTNVTGCNGLSNGSISVTAPSGGSGTYQYSRDGGGTWQAAANFTGLPAASYNVQIRDAANPTCRVTLNPGLSIAQPAALAGTAAATAVSGCFGNNNGAINITGISGGSGSYQFTRDNGTTWSTSVPGPNFTFSGLTAGTNHVRIRDAATPTCVVTLNAAVGVNQPAQLNASVSSSNVTGCSGGTNGSISITAPVGGAGTYEFTINGGGAWQSSGNFTGLGAGSYNVRMRDAVNPTCTRTLNSTLIISQTAILTATATGSPVTGCVDNINASITVSGASGGTSTYDYSIDGGSTWINDGTSHIFNGLTAGSYNVQLRDALAPACVAVINAALAITEPDTLKANITSTQVTGCFGNTNGAITISGATGGSGSYQYTINGSSWSATTSYINLGAGTYNVFIRDAASVSCTRALQSPLFITQPVALNADISPTNVTGCFGNVNANISIANPVGGSGTYQYTIDNGTTWGSATSYGPLSAGTYDVLMRDAANISCEKVLDSPLLITQPAALAATVSKSDVSGCSGSNDGSIIFNSASGGSGSYQFSIDGGASWPGSGTSYTFSGLAAASYNAQIRDALNTSCVIVLASPLTVGQPTPLTANVTSLPIVACYGDSTGSISISAATGGSGTYQYSINGGTTWPGSGPNFNFANLPAGTYNVRMRDAANTACTVPVGAMITLTQPDSIKAVVQGNNVTGCAGNLNGSIDIISASGGTAAYQYSKDGGSNWTGSGLNHTFPNLGAGTYDVHIRDANHITCSYTLYKDLEITEPLQIKANSTIVQASGCSGNTNGSIEITGVSGGSGSYEYTRNGGANWELPVSGGFVFSNLPAGSYQVSVRDANNQMCIVILEDPAIIGQPINLTAAVSPTPVTVCYGNNNGSIVVSGATGGSGVYEYSKDGGANYVSSGNFTGLSSGVYNMMMRDAATPSCAITLDGALSIGEPSVLNASITPTSITTCNGDSTGQIAITAASGGSGSYDYSILVPRAWSASGNFNNLKAGTYQVVIRDRNFPSCMVTLNAGLSISQPTRLSADFVKVSNVTACNGNTNGALNLANASGGSGSYEYSRNGSNWLPSGNFTGLAAGNYLLQIRDAANPGCLIDSAFTITEPTQLDAEVSTNDVSGCSASSNGNITISDAKGGSGTYEYSIDIGSNWTGNGNYQAYTNLSGGTYHVVIRDKAQPSCFIVLESPLIITGLPPLSATVDSTNVTICSGLQNGSIEIINASGGSGNYVYSIDNGNTKAGSGSNYTFQNVMAGTYSVMIIDATNPTCNRVLNPNLVISEPTKITGNITLTDINKCYGDTDGSITITNSTGGSGSYEYSMAGGNPWRDSPVFDELAAGMYNVQIRDKNNTGCFTKLDSAYAIAQPGLLTATLNSASNSTCAGEAKGSINISNPRGGSGTYEFTIGSGWSADSIYTNQPAATYNVQIRDKAHPVCFITLNGSLAITEPGVLSSSIVDRDIQDCYGSRTGEIRFNSPTGGSRQYDYSINGGATWDTLQIQDSLSAGTYSLRIRDRNAPACIINLQNALIISQPDVLSAAVQHTNVNDCNGASTGTITVVNPSGGSSAYEYQLDDLAPWSTTGSFTGLRAGSHKVVIRDGLHNDCQIVLNNALVITEPGALSAAVSNTNITECFGDRTGSISIASAAGGSGSYQFSINGGGSWSTQQQYTNLEAMDYTVLIRDAQAPACSTTIKPTFAMTQPGRMSGVVTSSNVSGCTGSSNGTITVNTPTGGSGQFMYRIQDTGSWMSNSQFSNLAPGTYRVSIQDAAHTTCIVSLNNSVSILHPSPDQPPVIQTQPGSQGPICEGTGAPLFNVVATGTDLNYQWQENGVDVLDGGLYSGATATTLQISNPTSAFNGKKYAVVITGKCGVATSSEALLAVINSSKGGTLSGSGDVCEGTDGLPLFVSGQTGNIIRWEKQVAPSSSWTTINANSSTYNPGILTANTTFRAIIRNGNCAETSSGLALQKIVARPSNADAGQDIIVCGNSAELSAVAPVAGVGAWYVISGNNASIENPGQEETIINGIAGNVYLAGWKVSNGVCSASEDTIQITMKTPAVANVTPDRMIKAGTQITLEASGGVEYRWQDHVSLSQLNIYNPVASPGDNTTYFVTVTNAEGCSDTASVTIAIQGVFVPNVFSPNDDGDHDVLKIKNIAYYPYAKMDIYNRWGQGVGSISGNNLLAGWDGKNNGSELPIGTYFYVIDLGDGTPPSNGPISILK